MQMATSGERGRVFVQRDSSLPLEPPLPVIGHSVGDVRHRRSPSAPHANATIPLNGGTTDPGSTICEDARRRRPRLPRIIPAPAVPIRSSGYINRAGSSGTGHPSRTTQESAQTTTSKRSRTKGNAHARREVENTPSSTASLTRCRFSAALNHRSAPFTRNSRHRTLDDTRPVEVRLCRQAPMDDAASRTIAEGRQSAWDPSDGGGS
jgi:hypothetical protein